MKKPSITEKIPADKPVMQAVTILCLVAAVWFLLGKFWPVGPDYYFTFRPATENFLLGKTRLYDSACEGYYNAPWTMCLLAPLLLFSDSYGQALLSIVTIGAALFSIRGILLLAGVEKVPIMAMLLAILTLHTFDLLLRGNVEGFVLLGLGLAWRGITLRRPFVLGLALVLLTIKPVNVLLPIVLFLYLARNWPPVDRLKALSPLTVVFLLSLISSGLDWPLRYWQKLGATPPRVYLQTSLWRAFSYFGLPREIAFGLALPALLLFLVILVRHGDDSPAVVSVLALATNLVITPYALGSHYVLLAPALVLLAVRSRFFLLLWLLTLTPLLRLWGGPPVAWLDIGYPLAIAIAALALLQRDALSDSPHHRQEFAPQRLN